MPGPLSDVRVVELAGIGPGPFAAMLLADMGADVVRVARPGDAAPDGVGEDATLRGRTHVEADLKTAAGREFVRALARSADALLEGFRPGVMERLALGPEGLLADNPRLVYARMTGYGQGGPMAGMAGHDINYISIAGVLGALRRPGEPPRFPLNLVGDYGGGGVLLALGLVSAVLCARTTGTGQVVDMAMTDGASLLTTIVHGLHATGAWRDEPGTNLIDGGAHFYEVYETADGRHMSVGAIEPQFYAELLARLGLPAHELPQWDRERWPAYKARLADTFSRRSRREWCAVFDGSDACVTPVLDLFEAAGHAHNVARESFVEHGGARVPAPSPRFSATPSQVAAGGRATAQQVLDRWALTR